jgi:hypothetical protein
VAEGDTPTRLSLSEEKLQLALAQLELRLRIYFDEQLKLKADAAQVAQNTAQLGDLRRGDFSPALKRSIEEVVTDTITARADSGWTSRQRTIAVVAIVVAVFSLAATIYALASARSSPVSRALPALIAPKGMV